MKRNSTGQTADSKRGILPPNLLSESLGYRVRATYQAFTRSLEMRLAEHQISISMWFFLRMLWQGDGQTQKDLSASLGLTQPTTVSAMDNLEARGLIRRQRNTEDRRKTNIYLTDDGWALRDKLIGYADEVNTVASQQISEKDLQSLWKILAIITENLIADRNGK